MSSVFCLAGNVTFSMGQICRLCLCRIFRSPVRHAERCCETKTRNLASKAFPHHLQIQSAEIQPLQPEHFLMHLPRLAQTTHCGRGRGTHTGLDQGSWSSWSSSSGYASPPSDTLFVCRLYIFYIFQLTGWVLNNVWPRVLVIQT